MALPEFEQRGAAFKALWEKLAALWEKLAGILTYSDETITKMIQNRDEDGYITSIEYYAGETLKFTLTVTRDTDNRITSIERT